MAFSSKAQSRRHGWHAPAVVFFTVAFLGMWGGVGEGPFSGAYSAAGLVGTAYAQADDDRVHGHGVEKKVEVWTCSMHPQIRLPNPGKCPICGMDLIPAEADKGGAASGTSEGLRRLVLSETARRLAQVRVSAVERKSVRVSRRLLGKLDYDERRLAYITSWVWGRLDRLYVDFTGTVVEKGWPMVELYSPELMGAQSELIHAVEAAGGLRKSGSDTLRSTAIQTIESAKNKLRLLGLTNVQIHEILRRGTPSDHITILAPIGGTVVHKDGFEGMYVKTGARIYTIADLSSLWLKLDAYESDVPWIRVGDPVRFETASYPGEDFVGNVSFIDPIVDEKTRTIKVRVDVPNRDGRLRPGMFVRAELRATISDDPPPLVIPSTAPLITGQRAVVYVAVPDQPGTYEGREVVLGPRADGYYVVRHGLREGDLVVTSGNFKIDSALQILAKPSMMTPEGGLGGGGHRHGEVSPRAAEGGAHAGVLGVSEDFRRQLLPVMRGYEAVRDAVTSRDWIAVRNAYEGLEKALKGVHDALLDGHARMVWNELSMLLENDVMIARYAQREGERQEAFASLESHMRRLGDQFGVQGAKLSDTSRALQVPEVFRDQLHRVLEAYLKLHEALAADKTQEALTAVDQIGISLSAVDMSRLQGEAHTAWMRLLENLQKALALMAESKDLEGLRKGFAKVSEAIVVMARNFSLGAGRPLYHIRCPMAFEGQGATWLQPDETVRNPYYGALMLSCGEVPELLR